MATFRETLSGLFRRTKPSEVAPAQAPAKDPWSDYDQRSAIRVRETPRDLPIVTLQDWGTVQAVRGALTDLDRGQFAFPALMLDAMLGDSHIAAKLGDRLDGVFGSPFDMVPPPGMEEDDAALSIAEDCRSMWPSVGADHGDRAVMRDGIMLGAGLGEVVVDVGDDEWNLRLKHWHARHVWWNWGTRAYHVTTMRGSEQLIPDGRGGYLSTWRDEDGAERVSRWLLYTPYGYQRGWVNGRIKAVTIPWLLRTWAFRDWGRHSEVLGIPPRKVKMPAEWDDEEKKRALKEVASMASEAIIRCPQRADGTGFDVDLLELKGPNGWEAFDKLIARAEAAITIAIVGQTLSTQNDSNGGSRALGEVHERVENRIRSADAQSFSAAAHAAICVPWCEFNHGDVEMAPFPVWAVDPPSDLRQTGEGLAAVGLGFAALQAAGVPVDRAKVCQEAGIPIEEGGEFREYEPPEPPQAPGDGEDDPEAPPEKKQNAAARESALLTREILASRRLGRRARAPLQGQAFVDNLAAHGKDAATKILAGDVRALRKIIATATADADGRIDAVSIKAKLLEVYREMKPDDLARAMTKVRLLAELAGRYAVTKEVVSE